MDKERTGWEERARWCHEAGVMYWKVDWGRGAADGNYRRMMTECVRKYAPALKIEHALVRQPASLSRKSRSRKCTRGGRDI